MKTIDRYIFKQVALSTIVGVLLFIVIWISPEILFRIIRQVIYGEITPIVGVKLFALEIPEILGKAIPVGLLLGTLFSFDRLSRDFELIIMRCIGVPLKRLAAPVLLLSVIGSILCFVTYEKLIPYSTMKINELRGGDSANQFVYVDRDINDKPKQIVIVSSFDGKEMKDLQFMKFSDKFNDNTPIIKNIYTAEKANYDGNNWVLRNGKTYQIGANGVYETINSFTKVNVFDKVSAQKAFQLLSYSIKKPEEMPQAQLKSYAALLKSEKMLDEYRYFLNKIYQRYSQAFSCIVFGICGVVLGISKPREKRFLGFTAAAIIIFLYYMTAPFLDMLAQKGILPPIISAWLPCAIILTGLFFIVKKKQI